MCLDDTVECISVNAQPFVRKLLDQRTPHPAFPDRPAAPRLAVVNHPVSHRARERRGSVGVVETSLMLEKRDEGTAGLAQLRAGAAFVSEERLDQDAVKREHGEARTRGNAPKPFVPSD